MGTSCFDVFTLALFGVSKMHKLLIGSSAAA